MRSVDHRNITFDIIRHAEATPDAPALLLPDSEISYAALNRLIWTFAQVLHDRGVRAGDTVALTFAEELNLALTMFAVTRLGATVFSIAQSATPIQRKAFAAQAQAKLLLTDRPGQFDSGLPEIQMDLQSLKNVSPRINRDILVVNPVAPWLFVIGSGTTGKPMLMPVTHAQQNARSPMAADWLGITQTIASRRLPILILLCPNIVCMKSYGPGHRLLCLTGTRKIRFRCAISAL